MSINEYFTNMEQQGKSGKTFTSGEWYAYRAWRNTLEYKTEMFEAEEIPWGSGLKNGEMEDFVITLRNAGVTEFAVTDHSTALMEGVYALTAAGCKIKASVIVKRHPEHWGETERFGLLFTV